MNLSEKIYNLRKKNHISQEELASKIGVSRQAVSKWETGQTIPDIDNILLLSKILNVSTDYLLLEEDLFSKTTLHKPKKSNAILVGIIIFLLGFIGTVVAAVLILLNSSVASQNAESVTFNISGYFVVAALFYMIFVTGLIILLVMYFKKGSKK